MRSQTDAIGKWCMEPRGSAHFDPLLFTILIRITRKRTFCGQRKREKVVKMFCCSYAAHFVFRRLRVGLSAEQTCCVQYFKTPNVCS